MNRDLIKDLLKYSPSLVVPAIVGILTLPLLTRLFPPGDYGNYILVMSTVSILVVLSGWLNSAIIRFYPECEKDGRLNELTSTVLIWISITVAGLSLLYAGVVVIVGGAIETQLHSMLLIGVIVFALTSFSETLKNFLRAKRWAGLYSGFHIWRSVVGFGIGILLVLVFDFGIEGMLWGSALGMVLSLPFLWKTSVEHLPRLSITSKKLAKEMAAYGFPLVVGNVAAWLLSLSDRYMLEFLRSSQDVGIYSASYTIAERSIYVIIAVFMMASGPLAIHVWEKQGLQSSRDFVTSLTRYYLLICVPVAAGMSVLSIPITDILVGAEYREGYRIIPFIVLGALLLGLQHRFQVGLIFFKKTSYVMIAIVTAGLINILLNLFLIPRYGYMAAAFTTLVSYVILLVLMIAISSRFFVWRFPFGTLARTSVASAIMAAAVYALGNNLPLAPVFRLIIGISVGAFIYPLLLIMLGEISRGERETLKHIVARYLPDRLTPTSWKKAP